MNSKRNVYLKIFFVIATWSITIYKIYIDFDHKRFLNDLIHTGLIVTSIVISLIALRSDYLIYKKNRKLQSFVVTTLVVLFIAGLFFIKYFLKKQDDTPTVLYAVQNNKALFDHFSIDFRENNTYKISDSRGFFETNYTRGSFTQKDSFIYLDKSYPFEKMSKRLLIRLIPQNDSALKKKKPGSLAKLFGSRPKVDTIPLKYLFQINEQDQIIDSARSFKIVHKLFN